MSSRLQSIVGELHRWRLGSSGDPLWIRAVLVLSKQTPAPRIREIRVWRMDSDLCDPDVHQSVNLPILAAHPGYQSPHPPSTSRCRLLGSLERRPHSHVDLSVHSGGCSLEQRETEHQQMFFQRGASKNNYGSSAWVMFHDCATLERTDTYQSSPSSRTFSSLHTQSSCSGVCK